MLAINTAFMTANLALKTADGDILVKDIDAKSKHSENVLKTIDDMCTETDINILDVGTVAVVTGPGSFTGLRIGVAIAKALGEVKKDLKFISLSSLELMAYIVVKNKMVDSSFVCALNALSNLYFVASFDKNGIKLCEEKMINKEEYDSLSLPKFSLVGDIDDDSHEISISSEDLLEFALNQEKNNKFVSIDELLPVYLRLSQAEDNLLKKSKKD